MWRQLKIVAIFQFTPLREGRRDVEYVNYWQIIFQFTPLREGRRDQWGNWVRKIKFQFTPLREGRHCTESRCYSSAISIHAPPRGATNQFIGGDVLHLISIHAPPRGATLLPSSSRSFSAFQFTPLREGRLSASHCDTARRIFQFTPLREGRRRAQEEGGNAG